jgi:hypothetical protein
MRPQVGCLLSLHVCRPLYSLWPKRPQVLLVALCCHVVMALPAQPAFKSTSVLVSSSTSAKAAAPQATAGKAAVPTTPAGKAGATTAGKAGATTAGKAGATTAGKASATTAGKAGATTAGKAGATTAGKAGATTAGKAAAPIPEDDNFKRVEVVHAPVLFTRSQWREQQLVTAHRRCRP